MKKLISTSFQFVYSAVSQYAFVKLKFNWSHLLACTIFILTQKVMVKNNVRSEISKLFKCVYKTGIVRENCVLTRERTL